MSQDDYNAEEIADLKKAYALLGGISEKDEKGLPKRAYMIAKSAEELEARKSLARLLRNPKPLDSMIRMLLAGLFDPDPFIYFTKGLTEQPESKTAYSDRQITFVKPGRQNREDDKHLKIAHEVWEIARKDGNVEAAVNEVMATYAVSSSTVWNSWREFAAKEWASLPKKAGGDKTRGLPIIDSPTEIPISLEARGNEECFVLIHKKTGQHIAIRRDAVNASEVQKMIDAFQAAELD